MQGIHVVYYLVHSLGGGSDFSERDLAAARNCANAAKSAGVERIIYLGGLGDAQADLSPHLALTSRNGRGVARGGRASDGISRGGDRRFGQFVV